MCKGCGTKTWVHYRNPSDGRERAHFKCGNCETTWRINEKAEVADLKYGKQLRRNRKRIGRSFKVVLDKKAWDWTEDFPSDEEYVGETIVCIDVDHYEKPLLFFVMSDGVYRSFFEGQLEEVLKKVTE